MEPLEDRAKGSQVSQGPMEPLGAECLDQLAFQGETVSHVLMAYQVHQGGMDCPENQETPASKETPEWIQVVKASKRGTNDLIIFFKGTTGF